MVRYFISVQMVSQPDGLVKPFQPPCRGEKGRGATVASRPVQAHEKRLREVVYSLALISSQIRV